MEHLHLEILDDKRRSIFNQLAYFNTLGYLAGGTALALQAGHRVSYDFDIFCPAEIKANFPAKVRNKISIKEVLVNSSDEFTFLSEDDVIVSFIFYPFKLDSFIV